MASIDPEEQRAEMRECWEDVASGWDAAAEPFYDGVLPVSHWMVEHLRPQPGETVLELAAGRGDTGFLAAELLHPGGRLICTDGAEAMVEIARRRGEALGLRDVEYRTMELEWIDASAASIDGILCRFGFMLALDCEASLREARRVLKPGGRLAIAVWGPQEDNPWMTTMAQEARRLGFVTEPPPPPGAPGPFALSAPGAVEEVLEDAGFDAPLVERIELTFAVPSADAWWETQTAMSPMARTVLAELSPADHYRLRDAIDERLAEHTAADGSISLPGLVLGAATEA